MVKNYFKSIRLLNLALLGFIFWGLMLNLYGIIDSYVDYHLKDFPENEDLKKDKKE